MFRIAIMTAALLIVALPVFAQDECSGCPDSAKAAQVKGESAWAKQLADLEAKAAKGDKRAEAALTAACDDCGTGCKKTMTAKIVKLEAAAAKGDEKAKAKLGKMKWDMVFASLRAAPLTEQVSFYAKACDQGCEISKRSMAILMKETGAKDRADLTAKLTALETKAAKGCGECKQKLAAMSAKLAPVKAEKKVSLSARIEKLAVAAKGGDKAAQESLARIAASIESKPENLVADLRELEAKATDGCQKCVAKLAKVQTALKSAKSCDDCGTACGGCDEGCEKTCPVDAKPVKQ